jgi:hypothetical protein
MNKTVAFFGTVIFLVISWLIGFVNELQDDVDVSYGFNEKTMIVGDIKNYKLDSNGDRILELSTLSLEEKKKLWSESLLKEEMLKLFPNFSEIKYFIENRIQDDGSFKDELLVQVEQVQESYISGSLTGKKAKVMLSNI